MPSKPAAAAGQSRALWMSTIAFTVCFAVWTIFAIIGVQIKKDLGLNETQFGLLVGTPILSGSLIRIMYWRSKSAPEADCSFFITFSCLASGALGSSTFFDWARLFTSSSILPWSSTMCGNVAW